MLSFWTKRITHVSNDDWKLTWCVCEWQGLGSNWAGCFSMPSSETVLPILEYARMDRKLPCEGQGASCSKDCVPKHAFISDKLSKSCNTLDPTKKWDETAKARAATRAHAPDYAFLSINQGRVLTSGNVHDWRGRPFGRARAWLWSICTGEKIKLACVSKGPSRLILYSSERNLSLKGQSRGAARAAGPSIPLF